MNRCVLRLLAVLLGIGSARAGGPPSRFEQDVLPILKTHCLKCHGTAQRKGGLSLSNPAAMLQGGDNGPALVKGDADESLLIEHIESGAMPPGKAARLAEAEVATLKAWITAGAISQTLTTTEDATDHEPIHWAFRPPQRGEVPSVASRSKVRNTIDAFLLAKLEAAGLGFSSEADSRTLIRRVTFDLWGLPPSREDIDAFLADTSPAAYTQLVDRLLADPRYGERWGRHWLDLAGYADSEGILDADHIRTAAWRYRDWVIRAFNSDMPYDRFLKEQIAGDELVDYWKAYKSNEPLSANVVDSLVATGYLRCASDTSRPDFVNIKNAAGYYYQTLEDTVTIVSTSTLGLTVQCAKCHTHKYDPITQAEYYRVQAIFMSGYRPAQWVAQVDRKRNEANESQEVAAKANNDQITAAIARRTNAIDAITSGFGDRWFANHLKAIPEQIREDVNVAFTTAGDKRTEVQRYLFTKFEAELRPPAKRLVELLNQESSHDRDLLKTLHAGNTVDTKRRISFAEIRAFYDLPGEPKTPILQRGDYLKPGREVLPGALPALATPQPFAWQPPDKDAPTSGRRRAFAEWLTQPGHPLTARVLVNRLWLHHFGEGIVATPDNFGIKGAAPSHPELLDWLATELIAQGWSMKSMHRLIMNSSAYCQSSRNDPESQTKAQVVDPEDRLLWRQKLRRLEAEAVRDAVLSVSGTLDMTKEGPPVAVVVLPEGEVVAPEGPAGQRRSIYLQVRRSKPLTLLQVFDQPVMETNCARRSISTVASQALSLLNSEFLTRQSEAFAARVVREAPLDPARHAVGLAFGRLATESEAAVFRDFVAEQTERKGRKLSAVLADLCHMLLSSNEFSYID